MLCKWKFGTVFVVSFGLAACATAPADYSFEKSRVIASDFDATWVSVIAFFAENNIPIKTVEKDSGLIVAENERLPPLQLVEYADCGKAFFRG